MPKSKINRHKTAIKRNDYSLPVKCLWRDSLISTGSDVFDYGCGHGENIDLLRDAGVTCDGWDPVHRPAEEVRPAEIVNLGYVINVIEDPQERNETLLKAWNLAQKVFVVSAQIYVAGRGDNHVQFGDGVLTRRNTFQKFYIQSELREYLETVLETDALPAALGIFYVFKDEALKQQFVANRYRRRSAAPRKRLSEIRFEQHRELLESFMGQIAELGRLPHEDEFTQSPEVIDEFGSLKRAFALIKRVTGEEDWQGIGLARTEDLIVYLALARFGKRQPLSKLPVGLQRDIRAFFGSYKRGCELADALLFSAGDEEAIDEACCQSEVGYLMENGLIVHKTAVSSLVPLLRVYEGCARAYLGDIEDTNIVKIHRFSGKVSYLSYPDFEKSPHPTLQRTVKLSLRNLSLHCYDFLEAENPPVLHYKDKMILPDHELKAKFARLTRQEEKHGLLEDMELVKRRDSWRIRLDDSGFVLKGHRLVRQKRTP